MSDDENYRIQRYRMECSNLRRTVCELEARATALGLAVPPREMIKGTHDLTTVLDYRSRLKGNIIRLEKLINCAADSNIEMT